MPIDSRSGPSGPADRERAHLAAALERTTRLLEERVKELACIHAISRLFDRREATLEETLQAVVEVIPRAWQYPDLAEARITLDDSAFQSAGYQDTEWKRAAPMSLNNGVAGALTVCYTKEPPGDAVDPFLAEERELLNTLAQRLSGYVVRHRTMESLLSYQEDLRRLASELSLTEQQERRRIAEGLHDRIGQNLALVSMRLGTALQAEDATRAAGIISEARELLSDVIAETRALTFELCPPILYELGLGPALDWLSEQFECTYGFRVIVRGGPGPTALPDDLSITLFQAVRELLTNAAQHAHATTVSVDISGDDDIVRVVVEDNGIGFDAADVMAGFDPRHHSRRGFGLFNIGERLRFMGGGLELDSVPGRGTVARLSVPRVATAQRDRKTVP